MVVCRKCDLPPSNYETIKKQEVCDQSLSLVIIPIRIFFKNVFLQKVLSMDKGRDCFHLQIAQCSGLSMA